MTFEVGTRVVYPAHGMAQIVRREARSVDGEKINYLVLSVPSRGWGTRGALMVSVPEERAEGLGVRAAVSAEDADEILEMMGVADVRVPANWSRRFKNHQEKLKSGDVYQCAEVVRNLAVRQRDAALSTAEKEMYARARHILVSELAVSWRVEDDEAEGRIDEVLGLREED